MYLIELLFNLHVIMVRLMCYPPREKRNLGEISTCVA
jgi:hypothetical protein